MKKKRLILPLTRKWFEMIKSGEKTEEYREYTPYWSKRLLAKNCDGYDGYKQFDEVEFTLGYPRKDDLTRRIVFSNPKIRYGFARHGKEWGAEKDKGYYIITWGKKL